MNNITLHGQSFGIFLDEAAIDHLITNLAGQLNQDYSGKHPVILLVLKGAFIFGADLVRKLNFPMDIDFVRASSYDGTQSTGDVKIRFTWEYSLRGRDVILVDDILDRGLTHMAISEIIAEENPNSIETVCLLHKPEASDADVTVKYIGMAIPSIFVAGYGMDFDQEGRDLPCIYKMDL